MKNSILKKALPVVVLGTVAMGCDYGMEEDYKRDSFIPKQNKLPMPIICPETKHHNKEDLRMDPARGMPYYGKSLDKLSSERKSYDPRAEILKKEKELGKLQYDPEREEYYYGKNQQKLNEDQAVPPENFKTRIKFLTPADMEDDNKEDCYKYPNEQGVLRHIVTRLPFEVMPEKIYYNPDVINPATKEPQKYQMNKDGTFTPIEGWTLSPEELKQKERDRKEAILTNLENIPHKPANSRTNSREESAPLYIRQDRYRTDAEGNVKVIEKLG